MNKNIIIAGHWEIGYMTPIQEQYYWSLVLRDFGVTEWVMSPVSGIRNNEQKVNLVEYENIGDFLEENSDYTRVFFEPKTEHYNKETIWLHEFEHPEKCIYIFGSAHFNPTFIYKRPQDLVVSIKTIEDKGVLWSNQCALMALYDRMVKSWL